MEKKEASKIVSIAGQANEGVIEKGSFASKVQTTIDKGEKVKKEDIDSLSKDEAILFKDELMKLHGGHAPEGSLASKIQSSADTKDRLNP